MYLMYGSTIAVHIAELKTEYHNGLKLFGKSYEDSIFAASLKFEIAFCKLKLAIWKQSLRFFK